MKQLVQLGSWNTLIQLQSQDLELAMADQYASCPHCDKVLSRKTLRKHKRLYYDPSIDQWQKKVCGGRATDIDDGWFDAVDFDAESDVNSQSGSDDRSLASIDAFVTTAWYV